MSKVTLHFVWGHLSREQTVCTNSCVLMKVIDWTIIFHLSQLEVFLGSIIWICLPPCVTLSPNATHPAWCLENPQKNSMWCWLIFIDVLSIKSEVIFLNPLKGVWHKQKSDDGDRSLNNSKAVDHNPTDNNLSINLLGTSGISSEISMLRSNLDESLMNVSRESHRSTHGGQ